MASERGNRLLRLLDRGLGIPLVRAAGVLHRKRLAPQGLERAAVLCLGCIGDLVLLTGPLQDLQREHPGCRLTLFVSGGNAGLAPLLPVKAETVRLPLGDPLAAAAMMRAHGPFDAVLDSSQWARIGALLSVAARSGFRAGFRAAGQHRHHAFDAVAEHSAHRHELDNFRALFALLGVSGLAAPRLNPPREPEAAEPPFAEGRPYAVLHLFPGGLRARMKQWPLDRWTEVGRALLERGLALALSGGPADAAGNEELLRTLGSPLARNLAGLPLAPTARLLRGAAVAVCVNTGVMHMAAALGVPLVSLNGAVSVERWGPVAGPCQSVALCSVCGCAPCLHLGFEHACAHPACMEDLTPRQVIEAVEALLRGQGAKETGA